MTTTARFLVLATNNSAVFTVLFRKVGHWQKCGRRRKYGKVSCTECTGQKNDLELIPTAKIKTRHPVKGSFSSEFLAVRSHCGVMAVGNLKTPKSIVK